MKIREATFLGISILFGFIAALEIFNENPKAETRGFKSGFAYRQPEVEKLQELQGNYVKGWSEGYNSGYYNSVVDSFYRKNMYIIDDKSQLDNAVIYKQVDEIPIHKGVTK